MEKYFQRNHLIASNYCMISVTLILAFNYEICAIINRIIRFGMKHLQGHVKKKES